MATSSLPWTTAWITGASTGIGREVALQLAQAGVKVAASDRVADKLLELEALHPGLKAYPLDVTDDAALKQTVDAITAQMGPIDLAVLCAAIAPPMDAVTYNVTAAMQTMDVNYNGILRAYGALMPGMIERRSGHLAAIASVTGYRGMSDSAAYAPTKAAVISLTETLKLDLERYGIKISVINPGFVDTQITKDLPHERPYLMTPSEAARRIVDGLKRGRYEIAFPWQMILTGKLLRLMPNTMFFWLSRRIDEAGTVEK